MDPGGSSGPARAGFRGDVDVVVTEPAWRRLVPHADSVAARAARAAGASGTVVLAADRTVRRLNARHRRRNASTNVLTYTAPAPEMLLALGVIRREAEATGRRPAHHLAQAIQQRVAVAVGHARFHGLGTRSRCRMRASASSMRRASPGW